MPDSEDSSGNEEGGLDTIVRTSDLQGDANGLDAGEYILYAEYEAGPKGREYRTNKDSKGSGDDKSLNHKRTQRKSANHSGIAALLAEDTNDNNGKISSRKLLAEYALGDSLTDRLESKADEEEKRDPGHAALVFIYNEETGEGIYERKPVSYSIRYPGHGDKLALFGGHVEPGEMPYHTVCREIFEEVSERAARIIVKHIDPNPRYVGIEHVEGIPVKNYVFEAKIPIEDWDAVRYGHAIADAGDMVIKPLEEIAASKGKWAFYHYDIGMKFIKDQLHYPAEWTKSPGIDFKEPWALFKALNLCGANNSIIQALAKPNTATELNPVSYDQLKYAA